MTPFLETLSHSRLPEGSKRIRYRFQIISREGVELRLCIFIAQKLYYI